MPRSSNVFLNAGEMFGFWKVMEDRGSKVECICVGCNQTTKLIPKPDLTNFKTRSCGCQRKLNKARRKEDGKEDYKSNIQKVAEKGLPYSEMIGGYEVLFSELPDERQISITETLIKKSKVLPGQTYHYWKVLNFVNGVGNVLCECLGCEAKTKRVMGKQLITRAQTKSCGCQVSAHGKEGWRKIKEEGRLQAILEQRELTCLEKYGETNYTKTEEYHDKTIRTNLERYGHAYHMQRPEFGGILKAVSLEKYGVESPSQLDEVKEKVKATNLERYGVGCYLEKPEVVEKTNQYREKKSQQAAERNEIRSALIEADNAWREENRERLVSESSEKRKKTNLDRYGTLSPPLSQEARERIKQTNLERYGVTSVFLRPDVKEKAKQTSLEKYGVENCFQSEHFQKEIKPQICLEKYGVESPSQLDKVKDKIKQTNLKRYGVEHHSMREDQRILRRQKNMEMENSFSSKGELEILEHVRKTFPSAKKHKIKNHELDIFIPELNFGIEFNGLCYHHVKAKPYYYHLTKSTFFKLQNIQVVHIWDFEYNKHKQKVLDFIDLFIQNLQNQFLFPKRNLIFSFTKNLEKIEKAFKVEAKSSFYQFDRSMVNGLVEVFDQSSKLIGHINLVDYQGRKVAKNYFSYDPKILDLEIAVKGLEFLKNSMKLDCGILLDRRFYFDLELKNLTKIYDLEPLIFWQIRGRYQGAGEYLLNPLIGFDLEKELDILVNRYQELYEKESEVIDCGISYSII